MHEIQFVIEKYEKDSSPDGELRIQWFDPLGSLPFAHYHPQILVIYVCGMDSNFV
jgi:hypothetical protein